MAKPIDQPIISVVIPTYNRENLIVPAIESVLIQEVENIEIILVDDCSTDKTIEAIQTIKDPRINIIKHKKNKGEAGARNTGVRAATGKYIAYLDSDDQWIPGKLQAQLDIMENAPDHIGGVYTLHYRLYQNGKKSIAGHVQGGGDLTFEKLLTKGASISAGNTLMFRRDLFKTIGNYDENAPLYVDWDWLLRFLKISSLVIINKPYAIYEKNPCFRSGEMLKKAHDIFMGKFQKDVDDLSPRMKKECLSRMMMDIARGTAENEGRLKSIAYYWQAIKLNPLNSIGSYINMFDGVFGTNTLPYIDAIFRKK